MESVVDAPMVPTADAGGAEPAAAPAEAHQGAAQDGAAAKAAEGTEQADFWGQVRTVAVEAAGPILPFDGSDAHASEQYRIARTRILHDPARRRMILVSSVVAQEGKTLTAVNLAGVLALKGDAPVLLADGDLRRSALHTNLGIERAPGLKEVLTGQCRLEQALVRVKQLPSLFVLTAGENARNPTELLESGAWKALARTLRERFRFIVIDSPPMSTLADNEVLREVCDGVVMVARPDVTPRALFMEKYESLPRDKRMGILLNHVVPFLGRGSGNGYGYYRMPEKQAD
jgi:capsular exopolysaccharide synthesis family protein